MSKQPRDRNSRIDIPLSPDLESTAKRSLKKPKNKSIRSARQKFFITFGAAVLILATIVSSVLFIKYKDKLTARNIKSFYYSFINRTDKSYDDMNLNLSDSAVFTRLKEGVIAADYNGLRFVTADGIESDIGNYVFTKPILKEANDRILIYDSDSGRFVYTDGEKILLDKQFDYTLSYAGLSDGGITSVVAESGNLCGVTVYNLSCEEIFKYRSSEYFGVCAEVSSDGKYLVFAGLTSNESDMISIILIIDLAGENIKATVNTGSSLPIAMKELSGGSMLMIFDNKTISIDMDGNIINTFDFNSSDLLSYSFGDNFALCLLNQNKIGDRYELISLNPSSNLLNSISTSQLPVEISAGGNNAVVIYNNELDTYSRELAFSGKYDFDNYLEGVSCNNYGDVSVMSDGILMFPLS